MCQQSRWAALATDKARISVISLCKLLGFLNFKPYFLSKKAYFKICGVCTDSLFQGHTEHHVSTLIQGRGGDFKDRPKSVPTLLYGIVSLYTSTTFF